MTIPADFARCSARTIVRSIAIRKEDHELPSTRHLIAAQLLDGKIEAGAEIGSPGIVDLVDRLLGGVRADVESTGAKGKRLLAPSSKSITATRSWSDRWSMSSFAAVCLSPCGSLPQ